MRRWLKISLICLAVIIGLMLLSMLVVPWQLKKQGTSWIAQNTDRTLSIEKAYFNPFTLTLEVDGVKLSEQNAANPFFSFSRLTLSLSSRSLIDWALILDRVELDDPFVNIARLAKEEFNFSDFTRLGGDKPVEVETAPAQESEPFHFSLNNIVIKNGSVDFHDLSSARESRHQIRQFDLSVPFIGNVPYLANVYVKPALFMLLNGAEVKATGELKPFHDSLETNLDVSFHGIKLPFYAEQSPVALPLLVEDGDIDFHLGLSYLVSASQEPQLLLNGEFALSDLALKQLDGSDLFSMETLVIDLEEANVFEQQAHFLAIDIYTPELFVEHYADGLWNWQKLLPASTPSAGETARSEETAAQLPLVLIDSFAIHEAAVHYRDETVPEGFTEDIEKINLNLSQLSTYPDQPTMAELNLQTGHKAQLEVNGDFTINPLQANVDILLNGVALDPLYPYLASQLTAPLNGTVNLGGHVRYTLDGNVLAEQVQIGLHDFRAPFGEQDYFSLPLLSLTGSSFDLKGQNIKLGELTLQQGDAQVTRLADGSVSPLLLVKNQNAPAEEPEQVKQPNENNWQLSLAQLKLERFKLKYTDETDSRVPAVSVPEFNLSAADLSYPKAQQAPFSISARIGKKGTVAVRGKVRHTPLQLNATTDIKAFPLADFNDFIPADLNLKLKDGKLYSSLKTAVSQQDNVLLGDFSGGLNVSDFNLRDPLASGEMLSWKNLNLNSIEGTLNPFALRIKEVALSDYLANITINEDGRINLTGLTAEKEDSNAEAPAAEQKSEPVAAEAEETGPAPDIRIDALTLQGGTVSFTDRHMPSTFATTMYRLGGRVSGMASDPEMQADVDLRGQLENHSPLAITGKLNPLSRDLFADLTLSFKDIDLTPMSPYSGTYVGYIIAKGKLNLDLNYHIEHQQIDAENRVMIDQFTFGDKVESDKATSLPVGLAIALLKDKNDEIHLDIPISGNLNDPKFSIAGAVWTIVRNLLVKAATSPFALLSALGGGDQDFSSVDFANGVATLDAKQLEKLQSLAKMLSDRPGLTLEISGFADADNDPEAYRQAQLQRMINQAKFAELTEEGTAPESISDVTVSAEEYPGYLLQVYKDAEFPRPRNVIGMLKDLPDEEMEKLLLANIIAGEEQIAGLAKDRALAVRNTLEELDPELKPRLFLKSGDIYKKAESGPASRVEFSISVK